MQLLGSFGVDRVADASVWSCGVWRIGQDLREAGQVDFFIAGIEAGGIGRRGWTPGIGRAGCDPCLFNLTREVEFVP